MTARSHADKGQLFGYDGQTMWVEQTLEVAEPRALVTCRHSVKQDHDIWDPCGCGYPDWEYGRGCVCPCHGETDPAWCATCRVFVDWVDDGAE